MYVKNWSNQFNWLHGTKLTGMLQAGKMINLIKKVLLKQKCKKIKKRNVNKEKKLTITNGFSNN